MGGEIFEMILKVGLAPPSPLWGGTEGGVAGATESRRKTHSWATQTEISEYG